MTKAPRPTSERSAPTASADRLTPEQIERRRKAEAAARWATEISEQKTEGRTPRPFRTNPHEP